MSGTGSTTPSPSLVEAFSVLAQHVQSSEDPDDSMARTTTTAVDALPGCDAASLSLHTRDGPVTRRPPPSSRSRGTRIQYQEGEGPCLDGAMRERWLHVPSLSADQRWPRSGSRMVAELGVGSMVSCRLTLGRPTCGRPSSRGRSSASDRDAPGAEPRPEQRGGVHDAVEGVAALIRRGHIAV